MSLQGIAESKHKLRGSLSMPDMIVGKSAYEIAVMNGFGGTVEEWLASMKGAKGDKGDTGNGMPEVTAADDNKTLIVKNGVWVLQKLKSAKIGEVTLRGNGWVGEASPYSQVVAIDGVTANSQVDLTPSVQQLAIFHQKDLTFVTENENGVVTVYAIGQKPELDYTIQVTITEVDV